MGATQLADLPEGVLSKVLGHLSVREWVYAAATCRALQDVQPDAIYMSKWCRPDAKGYRWILQRAGLAKFVRLMMGEKGAASLVKALKAHAGSPFKHLKVLEVKDFSRLSAFQFSRPDCNRVLRMALRAYPGIPGPPLRIASIVGFHTIMPPMPCLQHLEIQTKELEYMCETLDEFTALKTLKLGGSPWFHDMILNLEPLHALEHLIVMNFAPGLITAAEGCQLHAIWDELQGTPGGPKGRRAWLRSKIWHTSGLTLASLRFNSLARIEGRDRGAWEKMMSNPLSSALQSFSLGAWSFGSCPGPIRLDKWKWLSEAKHVSILTEQQCWLTLSAKPAWESFSLNCRGDLRLSFPSTLGVIDSLLRFQMRIRACLELSLESLQHCMHLLPPVCKCSIVPGKDWEVVMRKKGGNGRPDISGRRCSFTMSTMEGSSEAVAYCKRPACWCPACLRSLPGTTMAGARCIFSWPLPEANF